jgi:YihY family inner membrane protein
VDQVDAFQRRHPVVGFPVAVVYKYFDDQGAYLAAIVTYYAFVAIFPLLLIASSVLGFLIQGNEELREELLDSALSTFPIVGSQLGGTDALQGSTTAVVIGAVTALYGVLGLAAAAQNALNVAWAVPRNSRFNPVVGRLRGFLYFALAGVVVIVVTSLSVALSNLGSLQPTIDEWIQRLGHVAALALLAGMLAVMMRYTTSRRPSIRACLPGAIVIALLWQGLQYAGAIYVRGVINRASDVNGVFALVLGLIALLFLAASSGVFGIEVSVVLRERLYPRALMTPFTDNVDLTDADRRAYESYAKAMRHKGFQRIEVVFEEPPPQSTPQSAAESPDGQGSQGQRGP